MPPFKIRHFKVSCPLCGSNNYKVLYKSTLKKEDLKKEVLTESLKNSLDDYSKHSQIVRCLECSMIYTNPMEDAKAILEGYGDVVDYEYLKTEKFRKILLEEHLNAVEKFIRPGKILDVGCFVGYFLELAKSRGWQVQGIEPSKWATKEAKKRKIEIIGKTLKNIRGRNLKFDVVTMWDVIEHIHDPNPTVGLAGKLLKKNGLLALATPNIESPFAKLTGKNCPFLIRMHLLFFSPKTLENLFTKNGFKVIYKGNYSRVFTLEYVMNHFRTKNPVFEFLRKIVLSFPFASKISIKIPFGESTIMIGKKI